MTPCNGCRMCRLVRCGIIPAFAQKGITRENSCRWYSRTRNSGARGKHFILPPPYLKISFGGKQKIPDDYSGIFLPIKNLTYETLLMLHPTDFVSAGLTFFPDARLSSAFLR